MLGTYEEEEFYIRKPVIPQKCDDSPEYKIKEENAGEQDHPSI